MKYTTRNKNAVLELLGQGLSVYKICERLGISFNELCEMAEEFGSLKSELKRWYPNYNFDVKMTVNDTEMNTEETLQNNEETTQQVAEDSRTESNASSKDDDKDEMPKNDGNEEQPTEPVKTAKKGAKKADAVSKGE